MHGDHLHIHGVRIIPSVPDALGTQSIRGSVRIVHTKEVIASTVVVIQLVGRVAEILLPIQSNHRPGVDNRFYIRYLYITRRYRGVVLSIK